MDKSTAQATRALIPQIEPCVAAQQDLPLKLNERRVSSEKWRITSK
jgi:hypothetical protein